MARGSRASSATALVTIALSALLCVGVSAHRRDEYLQAARIGIALDRVHIELDLTPGIAIAARVIRRVDSDADGRMSREEQDEYARSALRGVELVVDRRQVPIRLSASRFPDPDALRRGEGTIAVQADAVPALLDTGAHQLVFRNHNEPDSSVYLANALVPETDRVAITRQTRDAAQRELTIDLSVSPPAVPSHLSRLFALVVGAAVLVAPLRRRHRKYGNG